MGEGEYVLHFASGSTMGLRIAPEELARLMRAEDEDSVSVLGGWPAVVNFGAVEWAEPARGGPEGTA